ncbi:MAG: hypothetical protein KDN22_31570 [Verrucomicrobiae bacterium]|nr:hypothetical protein [Verrucomicrobiae bacterium]
MSLIIRRIVTGAYRVSRWALLAAAIVIVLLVTFALGWKSWSPSGKVLQASARRTVEMTTNPEGASKLKLTRAYKNMIGATIDDAIGAIRFGGGMGVGEAKAFKLVEDLEPSQLPTAFAKAMASPRTSSRDRLIDFILDRWARLDPAKAVAACAEAFGNDRQVFLDRTRMPMNHFAEAAPASAYAAWQKHYSPLNKDYDNSTEFQLSGIFSSWARQDLEAAFTAYHHLNGDDADYALRGLIGYGDEQRRDQVLALVEASGDTSALAEARKAIVDSMARSGAYVKAIEWMEAQNLDAGLRAPLEEEIAEGWFSQSPKEAAAWLLERSDDSNRADRLAEIARDWADWEANAAGEWLGKMIEDYGAQADKAIGRFAQTVANQDPSAAIEWVAAITDDTERQKAAERVGQQFSMRMMEGVEAILSDSSLNESDRATVLDASRVRRF